MEGQGHWRKIWEDELCACVGLRQSAWLRRLGGRWGWQERMLGEDGEEAVKLFSGGLFGLYGPGGEE